MLTEQKLLFSWWPAGGDRKRRGWLGSSLRSAPGPPSHPHSLAEAPVAAPPPAPHLASAHAHARSAPGVRLPGTFMYSCTVFIPRMVWPTWLSMLPVDVTRIKAGSFSSSCSWGFHLRGRRCHGSEKLPPPPHPTLPTRRRSVPCPTDLLASDRSMLVPNLMM